MQRTSRIWPVGVITGATPEAFAEFVKSSRAWTNWAAESGASATVAAALLLISKSRPLQQIAAKLQPDQFDQTIAIVLQWPNRFPPGTLAGLKRQRHALSQEVREAETR